MRMFYWKVEGKIPSPTISRQNFNSTMKIPDRNHTVCTLSKCGINQNMAQQISSILCFTHVDVYSAKKRQVLSHE